MVRIVPENIFPLIGRIISSASIHFINVIKGIFNGTIVAWGHCSGNNCGLVLIDANNIRLLLREKRGITGGGKGVCDIIAIDNLVLQGHQVIAT